MTRTALRASLVVTTSAALLLASACSSSSDTTPSASVDTGTSATDTGSSAIDTSVSTEDTGTSVDDTGSSTTDSTTSGDGGGGGCGSDPKLHPPAAGEGVFCPGTGDAGGGAPCATGQLCCDTPKGSTPASSCIAGGSTCPTTSPKSGSSWECDAPAQCGTGKVCCGEGTPKLRTGCTYEEVFPAAGSKCAASCGATEYVICEAAGDCPAGKTCTPIKTGGKQVGYCK